MTDAKTTRPVLFCYDGSQGSRNAMRAAAALLERPVDAVVLTVWETIATRLALAGAFAVGITTGGADLNEQEESAASGVAEEGAAPRQRARVRGLGIDQGVLRRHCQCHLGGGGRHLGPAYRLRPTRPRAPAERPSRQCLAPAGVARQAPCPHRSRKLGVTEATTTPGPGKPSPGGRRSADAVVNITQTV